MRSQIFYKRFTAHLATGATVGLLTEPQTAAGIVPFLQIQPVYVFYRPRVAGAVLQTPSTDTFYSKSSNYHKSQTERARELKLWENVHTLQHVTCHMSHVTCHMSCVTCHKCFLCVEKVVKLIGGGSVINEPTPSSFQTKNNKSMIFKFCLWYLTTTIFSLFSRLVFACKRRLKSFDQNYRFTVLC